MKETNDIIVNELDKDYVGKVEIIFSTKVHVDTKELILLNGYKSSLDLMPLVPIACKIENKKSIPELRYNYPDNSLYVVIKYHFSEALDKKSLSSIIKYTKKALKKDSIKVKLLDKSTYNVKLITNTEQNFYLKQSSLEPPKDFLFIEDIFVEEKDKIGYEEFLHHELSYKRLVKLCTKLGYTVTEDMVNGAALPIHRKHEATNSLLVHKDVQHQYEMYKFAQNYVRGFEVGSDNNLIGLAMAYDIKFNDYALSVAKRCVGSGNEPNQENFTDEYNKAIKRINQNY